MTGKEIKGCWASIKQLSRCRWFYPALTVVLWCLFVGATYVNWASDVTSGWIQAVGSIVGIGIAIAVPWYVNDQQQQRVIQDQVALNNAHAMRLFTVIWEALESVTGFEKDCYEYKEKATEINRVMRLFGNDAEPLFKNVHQKDVDFFNRIMHRAMTNLDDDACAGRIKIAAKFRYDLSVLISRLQNKVGAGPSRTLVDDFADGRSSFQRHIDQLIAIQPELALVDMATK